MVYYHQMVILPSSFPLKSAVKVTVFSFTKTTTWFVAALNSTVCFVIQ